jgi:hypothetical protein
MRENHDKRRRLAGQIMALRLSSHTCPAFLGGAFSSPDQHALARYHILATKPRLSEDGQGAWETIVIELSSKQARDKCHQTLVAGLRLIQPEERVIAIAAALQEVEARERRLYAAVVRK